MSSSSGTPQGIIKSTVATGSGDVLNKGSIAASICRSILVKGFDGKYQSCIYEMSRFCYVCSFYWGTVNLAVFLT